MTKTIAVYGSLKPGQYNLHRFQQAYGKGSIFPIEKEGDIIHYPLKGYNLYSLGAYPGIKPGDGEVDAVLLQVSSEVFGGIDVMEIDAGYIRKEIEDPDYGQITYWEFGGQVHESELVESGIW